MDCLECRDNNLVTYLTCIVLALSRTLSVIEISDDEKWNLLPSPKSDLRRDKALFCSEIACRLATVISLLGWIWLKFMLPCWKVLDNSDSTGRTSLSMYRAAIQSGDLNFFNSPSASSLKHKSMESRSSWEAFTAFSKGYHRVLYAFWRRFVTFFPPSMLRWTCFCCSWTLVYTERCFGELSKYFHSCRKFVSTLQPEQCLPQSVCRQVASLWRTQCMLSSIGQCLSRRLAARPPVSPIITDAPSLAREAVFDISMPSCCPAVALVDLARRLSMVRNLTLTFLLWTYWTNVNICSRVATSVTSSHNNPTLPGSDMWSFIWSRTASLIVQKISWRDPLDLCPKVPISFAPKTSRSLRSVNTLLFAIYSFATK